MPKLNLKVLAVIFFERVNFTPQTLYFTTQMLVPKLNLKVLAVIFFERVNFTPQTLYFTTQMFEG